MAKLKSSSMNRSAETEKRRRDAIALADGDMPRSRIAKKLNVSRSTVDRYLRGHQKAATAETQQSAAQHDAILLRQHTPRYDTYAALDLRNRCAHELYELSGGSELHRTKDIYYSDPPRFSRFERWPERELWRFAEACGLQPVLAFKPGIDIRTQLRFERAPSEDQAAETLRIGRAAVALTEGEDSDVAAVARIAIAGMLWYPHFTDTYDDRLTSEHLHDDLGLYRMSTDGLQDGIAKLADSDDKTENWIGQIAECIIDGEWPPDYYDAEQCQRHQIEIHGLVENAYVSALSFSDQIFRRALDSGHIVVVGDDLESAAYEFDCGSLSDYMEREYGIDNIQAVMQGV